MRDSREIVKQRQLAMRREIDRRAIALKQVQFDSGLPIETLYSYFPLAGASREPAVISAAALYRLLETGALPADLLALLLPPGWAFVAVPEEADHDCLADGLRDYLRAKDHCHHPASPAGREIDPSEDAALRQRLAGVGIGQ